jgi:heme-degrading monooxygenase HmoA
VYVIIWEYQIKADRVAEFEAIYSSNGLWVELFRRADGYQGTELLRDPDQPHRYITIDRWASSQDHRSFLLHWKTEYAALDVQCEHLTEKESLLGTWESISREIR